MTLDEAKMNFGREAVFTNGEVTERGEIRGTWFNTYVQFLVGEQLRMVLPESLSLETV